MTDKKKCIVCNAEAAFVIQARQIFKQLFKIFTITLIGTMYANVLTAQPLDPSGTLIVKGRLLNGSTNQATRAETMSLIALGQQGMQNLQTIKNAGPIFRFQPIERPRYPLMIRTEFQGISHTHIIRPDPNSQNKSQEITVFERGAVATDVGIYQGIKVTKLKNSLNVSQVLLMRNESKPPRNFVLDDYINLRLPEGAQNIQGRLQYRSTGMPINLNLQPGSEPDSLRLGRALRPDVAEISIDYNIPGHYLKIKPAIFLKPSESQAAGWKSDMVLLWSPRESIPTITSARTNQPQGLPQEQDHGDMLQLQFNPGQPAQLDFSAGIYNYTSLRDGAQNPIFNRRWITALGIVFVLCLFLTLIAGLRLSGIRLIKS